VCPLGGGEKVQRKKKTYTGCGGHPGPVPGFHYMSATSVKHESGGGVVGTKENDKQKNSLWCKKKGVAVRTTNTRKTATYFESLQK